MSSTNDRDLEYSEQIIAKILEDKIKKSRYRQCELNQYKDWDGIHCYECEEKLNIFRVDNGFVNCVDCQEELDHRNKLYARA